MTPKERMLAAVNREKPDRLPVSIHQWQQYHLEEYMDGVDALDAFKATGMDQLGVLSSGTPEQIRCEVHRLFEGFGREGGYIMSASDHFFNAPPEKLRVFAEAAKECTY